MENIERHARVLTHPDLLETISAVLCWNLRNDKLSEVPFIHSALNTHAGVFPASDTIVSKLVAASSSRVLFRAGLICKLAFPLTSHTGPLAVNPVLRGLQSSQVLRPTR